MVKYKVGSVHHKKKQALSWGEPGTYRVCFIDGHDLKYKTFTCEAENRVDAIHKMHEMFGANFDHQIANVYMFDGSEV